MRDASALYPRRYALKNRQRLNRLLLLMQLHINGDDDVQAYSTTIRRWLEANGGRPADRRRREHPERERRASLLNESASGGAADTRGVSPEGALLHGSPKGAIAGVPLLAAETSASTRQR